MPGKALTAGSVLTCSFGTAPTGFITLPLPGKPVVNGMPVGLVTDVLITNVPPFLLCITLSNATTASLTSAALGVLTPAPCTPVLAPWVPGSPTVVFGGVPIATNESKCICGFAGGVVSVTGPTNLTVGV